MKKPKLLLTGGHAGSTAYALITELKRQKKNWELFWIGPSTSLEGKNLKPLEHSIFPEMNVKSYVLKSGRIQRRFTRWTIPSILKIPIGFLEALYLVLKIMPDVVLSFGGYTAFPVVFWAWVMRKPIIIHEQTAAAGRANIFSAFFSSKIALSRTTSEKYFPKSKVIISGNPVEKNILKIGPKKSWGNPPTILITGGHTGSVVINDVILKILRRLLLDYVVIHQCGDLEYDKFIKIKDSLTLKEKKRYFVYGTISPLDWPETLEKADLIVSRGGANTVSQIMIIKRPAILIPIPFAYLNEQMENSVYARDFGIAEIIDQKELSPEVLLSEINKLSKSTRKMIDKVKEKKSPDESASSKLIALIENFIRN